MPTDIIKPPTLIQMMDNILTVMTANEDYLTRLDAEIGDADHGINMVRGFQLVHQRLKGLDNPDVEAVLSTVGTSLMEGAGGSSGALYGTFFNQGAQLLHGKRKINKRDLALFFSAGYAAMVEMSGGTKPGEKTMIDALDPAVKSLNESARDDGLSLTIVLQRTVVAAKTGLESTIGLVATKGRSAYLGEMSRGHQDIGATTMYLIIRTMLDTLEGKVGVRVTRHGSNGAILEETYI
jgi:dihydroxyacetone kinase-like protein